MSAMTNRDVLLSLKDVEISFDNGGRKNSKRFREQPLIFTKAKPLRWWENPGAERPRSDGPLCGSMS